MKKTAKCPEYMKICLYETKAQIYVYIHTNEEKWPLGKGIGLRIEEGNEKFNTLLHSL